MNKSFKLGVC